MTDEIQLGAENVGGVHEFFIRDLMGKRLVQLNRVPMSENFSFDPVTLKGFQQAEKVYVLSRVAVALAPNFQQHPEANFILDRRDIPDPKADQKIMKVLQENGIKFEVVSQGGDTILPAPDMYLIEVEQPMPSMIPMPRPLLRLRVPLEELDPSARPRVEAQRAQEIVDKRNANVVLVIGLIALIGLLGLTAFGAFRSLSGQQPRT